MSKFKVGDWIKALEPSHSNYGSIYKIVEEYNSTHYGLEHSPSGNKFVLNKRLEHYYALTPEPVKITKQPFTAPDILRKAEEIMRERGKQYDQQGGERSMEKIVNTFNAATGHNLTEAQGWMFMIFLKLVRDNSRTEGHQDSCEDLVAYSSLYGESRLS